MSKKDTFRSKAEAARQRELQAAHDKKRAEAPSAEQQAATALSHVLAKLQQPPRVAAHEETPFGEARHESSAGFALSATKLKRLPAYKQFLRDVQALCPRFTVRVTKFSAKLHGKTARVWQVVVEHPGLTRAQFFGDESGFSVYEKQLAKAFAAARHDRLRFLRIGRSIIAGYPAELAEAVNGLEQRLVHWFAKTGQRNVPVAYLTVPMYLPYSVEKLQKLPAFAALKAAAAALDPALKVSAHEDWDGMGNGTYIVEVRLPDYRPRK